MTAINLDGRPTDVLAVETRPRNSSRAPAFVVVVVVVVVAVVVVVVGGGGWRMQLFDRSISIRARIDSCSRISCGGEI